MTIKLYIVREYYISYMGHTEEEGMLSKLLLLEKKSSDIEHIHNKINTTRTALPKHLHKAWEND